MKGKLTSLKASLSELLPPQHFVYPCRGLGAACWGKEGLAHSSSSCQVQDREGMALQALQAMQLPFDLSSLEKLDVHSAQASARGAAQSHDE